MEDIFAALRTLLSVLIEHLANYGALVDQSIREIRATVLRRLILLVGAFVLLQSSTVGFMTIAVIAVERGAPASPFGLAIPSLALTVSLAMGAIALRRLPRTTSIRREVAADLTAVKDALGDLR